MTPRGSLASPLRAIVTEFRNARMDGSQIDVRDFLNEYPQLAVAVSNLLQELDRSCCHEKPDCEKGIGDSVVNKSSHDDLPTLAPLRPEASPSERSKIPQFGSSGFFSSNTVTSQEDSTDEPSTFGNYTIIKEIARGGMGVVYKARDDRLGRTVALKMILAGELAGPQDVRRFKIEAQAAAHLDHPNIVPIYEIGEIHGQHFFTMGFVSGPDLSDLLRRATLSPLRLASLVQQIALAIEYAHSKGVIHRDLKPSNVLIDHDYIPRVTDFGLAKHMGDQSELTQSGEVLGTPGYMAPEQAAGRVASVGKAADIYSLGALLFFCLTGRPPFHAPTALETLVKIIESEPPMPRKLNKSVPVPLERICMRCLQRDPKDRYQSAGEVAEDLDRFLQGQPVIAEAPSIINRATRFAKRAPAFTAHLVAVGFALVLAQIRFLTTNTINLPLHLWVTGLLLVWLCFCGVMQWLRQNRKLEVWADAVWLCSDAVLLSWLLYFLTTPTFDPEMLLIGFPLLIVASGLFFRVRLVITVTAVSLLSFIGFQVATSHLPKFIHHQIAFVVILALIGGCVAHQIRRVRMLSQYFDTKREETAR